jgi:site-specific recombinase XerD
MTDEAMSPLRRRMIEDMTIRKFAPKTQHDYVQRIKNFAAFLGRSPDTASFEDVRRYQLHLAASGVGVATINQTVSTLRFLFKVTLKRHEIVEHMHVIHEPRKLPMVLSVEEVARLLDAAPGLKYKTALSVAYGAGLRAEGSKADFRVGDPGRTNSSSNYRLLFWQTRLNLFTELKEVFGAMANAEVRHHASA